MNPIKKWAIIIPATIYSVKFESSLMVEIFSKLIRRNLNNVSKVTNEIL